MLNSKRFILIFVALSIIFCISSFSSANERKLVTSFSAKGEYTDNVFYDYNNEQSDKISILSGELEYNEITERLYSSISAKVDGLMYDENNELDTVDQFYNGDISYRITERFRGFGGAGYTHDSRTDRDFETTGMLLGTERRDMLNGTVGGQYWLTEISTISLSYQYNDAMYDDIEYTDYQIHQLNLGYEYDLGIFVDNTTFNMNFGYTNYIYKKTIESIYNIDSTYNLFYGYIPVDRASGSPDYEYNSTVIDSYSGTIGIDKDFTEKWRLLVNLGVRYHESTFIQPLSEGNPIDDEYFLYELETASRGWGGVGNLELKYQGEFFNSNVGLSHDMGASSGQDGSVERTSASLSLGYRLGEFSRISLNGGYHINKSEAGDLSSNEIDEETSWCEPRLRIGFNRHLAVEGSYRYSYNKDKVLDNTREKNTVYVRLVSDFDLLE